MADSHDRKDPYGIYGRKVAVALAYEPGGDTLPKIVAKGQGALAERILQLAFENGVKVREDRELARMLAAFDIDSEIPVEAMVAVAEILSHIYRENGRLKELRARRGAPE